MALKKRPLSVSLVMEPSRIDALHQTIMNILKKHSELDNPVIDQRAALGGRGAWKKAPKGSLVELELMSSAKTFGDRRNSRSVNVVRLKSAKHFWLSWFERWQVEELKSRLRLDTVSLGFWEGTVGSIHQLFRAEWDHCAAREASGTAQPHWNIDHLVPRLLPSGHAEIKIALPPTPKGLEELPPIEAGLVEESSSSSDLGRSLSDISQYHLCMGAAWTPPENPTLRHPYGADISDLLAWIELCLEHVSLELGSHGITKRG